MEKQEKLTIYQIFFYFLIFSIVGLIIETVFGYINTGVIESRKGLIWGPFCPVYGISGAVLILALNKYKEKNILEIFFAGFIVGSIAEYVLSFILESIYGMRFWEYGYAKINLNGRICLQYSMYWGILSVIVLKLVKPLLDKIISKVPSKPLKIMEGIIFVFLIFDGIFTVWGIQTYQNRLIENKINNKQTSNFIINLKQNIENNYFTNDRMSKTFPNLRFKDREGNEIWIKTLIKEE